MHASVLSAYISVLLLTGTWTLQRYERCKTCVGGGGICYECDDGGLTEVPQFLPYFITTLNLTRNNIPRVTDSSFLPYRKLMHLRVSDCRVERLAPMAFSYLYQLEYVDLSRNLISAVPPDMFVNNSNLNEVVLSGNNLKSYQGGPLFLSQSLQQLILQNVSLTEIPDYIFGGLPNLKVVDIRNNNNQVSIGPFQKLSLLNEVYITSRVDNMCYLNVSIYFMENGSMVKENCTSPIKRSPLLTNIGSSSVRYSMEKINTLSSNISGMNLSTGSKRRSLTTATQSDNCEAKFLAWRTAGIVLITLLTIALAVILAMCSFIRNKLRQKDEERVVLRNLLTLDRDSNNGTG